MTCPNYNIVNIGLDLSLDIQFGTEDGLKTYFDSDIMIYVNIICNYGIPVYLARGKCVCPDQRFNSNQKCCIFQDPSLKDHLTYIVYDLSKKILTEVVLVIQN